MIVSQQSEPLRFSWRGFGCAIFYLGGHIMTDYAKLYHLMVNAAENALTALEAANIWDAKRILIDAEQQAEDLYVGEET